MSPEQSTLDGMTIRPNHPGLSPSPSTPASPPPPALPNKSRLFTSPLPIVVDSDAPPATIGGFGLGSSVSMCRETGVEEEGEEGEGENQSAWIGLREGGRRDGLEGESSWKEGGRGWDTDR
jgi:hypothetical protein